MGTPESLSKSLGTVTIEGLEVKAFFDSGSTKSFIHRRLVEKVALTVHPSSGTVSMATSASSTVSITGTCAANLSYQGRKYAVYKLSVLPGLCADLIFGLDFQSQHSSVTFHYGGSEQSGIYLNLRTGPTGHATLFNQREGALVFINKQITTPPQ